MMRRDLGYALLLACAAIGLPACGADEPDPPPARDVFFFDSGGAHHIEGLGAWRLEATRSGALAVEHQVGETTKRYDPATLDASEREALWQTIEGARLDDLDSSSRPGVPDEVRYTFRLSTDEAEEAELRIWQNDLERHAGLLRLRDLLKALIEKKCGVKPVF